jgi:hypothetical protein
MRELLIQKTVINKANQVRVIDAIPLSPTWGCVLTLSLLLDQVSAAGLSGGLAFMDTDQSLICKDTEAAIDHRPNAQQNLVDCWIFQRK